MAINLQKVLAAVAKGIVIQNIWTKFIWISAVILFHWKRG